MAKPLVSFCVLKKFFLQRFFFFTKMICMKVAKKSFKNSAPVFRNPLEDPHCYHSVFFLPSLYSFLVWFSGPVALSKLLWQRWFFETKRLGKGVNRNNGMQNLMFKQSKKFGKQWSGYDSKFVTARMRNTLQTVQGVWTQMQTVWVEQNNSGRKALILRINFLGKR